MRNLLICLCLVAVTAAVYWRAGNLEFINYDDQAYIYENPHTTQGLTADTFFHAFGSFEQANYHPLTWISLALDVSMFGLNPRGFHLENVALHGVSSVLLFIFLLRATGHVWPAAFTAMIFAVHPIHVESVAWVTERKDTLSGLFFMLTLLAWLGYVRAPGGFLKWLAYLAAVLSLGLGLLAKQMLVTMPFVLLLFDFWPLARAAKVRWTTLILEKIPMLVLSVLASVATFYAQKAGGAMMDYEKLPVTERMENAAVAYMRYLGKIVWPTHLGVFYPHPIRWPIGVVLGSFAILIFITVWCIWNARRRTYLMIGWLFFLGTLVPVIGLVQIGWQSIADRYVYTPLIGPAIMLAWGADEWRHRSVAARRIVTGFALAVFVAASCVSVHQLQFWHDTRTLFDHDLAVTGDNTIANVQLAYLDTRLGHLDDAKRHYEEAIRIDPTYFVSEFNLANLLLGEGHPDLAIDHYRKAAVDRPGEAKIENNWGIALLKVKNQRDAFEHFLAAERDDPDMVDAHFNLGQMYLDAGQPNRARSEFERVLQLDPQHAGAKASMAAMAGSAKRNE